LQADPDFSSTSLSIVLSTRTAIPASVLKAKLSPLAAVVKYLKEVKGLSLHKISEFLGRSYRAVWGAYNSSRKSETHFPQENGLLIQSFYPNLSILESVVFYLKQNYSLTLAEIGKAIGRSPKTVWTVYNRALRKRREIDSAD